MTVSEPFIGAHMSIAGGVDLALIRGDEVGCRAIQIFTKNSNQWKGRALGGEEIERFERNRETTGIRKVIAHDSYLINLASPDEALRKKSSYAYLDEMERCRLLGIRHLVMHPGSHKGAGEEVGLKTISAEFNDILERTGGWDVYITLETTAGQGTNLGYSFEHLARIIDGVKDKERMMVCFDTCHAYAAGYDIAEEEGYIKTFEDFDRVIGLDRLALFHINDSKKGLGSRVDRHEQLGKGEIGEMAFRLLMNDSRFSDIPKILETPKGKDMEEDRVNLGFLRDIVS